MRLWFAPNSDVPLYRQLVTQVQLAILSGDLQPGDRLPSTRELARRFAIHPNTISAGYRQLEQEGWTETRHGSGVFVPDRSSPATTPEQVLDLHIAGFFRAVRELHLPPAAVRARVAAWLAAPPPDHLLLIDPDPDLRRILLTELAGLTSFPLAEATPDQCADASILTAAIPLCRPSKASMVRAALPSGMELITLPISSATAWLGPHLARFQPTALERHLLGVVSPWPDFLSLARTMLVAAGIPADALMLRNTADHGWQRGLNQASAILCDAYTATLPALPAGPHRIVFPLLAEGARDLLAAYTRPSAPVTLAKPS